MTTTQDKVFVTGPTGNIGTQVVLRLIASKVPTTVFSRNQDKVQSLFGEHVKSGLVTPVKGDYDDVATFTQAIRGHTRLFLLIAGLSKPTVADTFGRIAYEAGVKQIVFISSFTVTLHNNGPISCEHTEAEHKLYALATAQPNRSYISLRVGTLASNHVWGDMQSVKSSDTLYGPGAPATQQSYVDPRDVGDLAAAVFLDPVEKHAIMVYTAHPDIVSNEQRAIILSKVLGRKITYVQESVQDTYNKMINFKRPHVFAYTLIELQVLGYVLASPCMSVLLGRPVRTLEDWFTDNKAAFSK